MRVKLILLFSILIISAGTYAQEYILDSVLPYYKAIIHQDYNTLYYADSSENFNLFFKKIDSLYNGKTDKIHIFHIGGSHIQADIYSNKLRTYFQNMNDSAMSQRGFIFPFRLAGTNNPLNYRIDGNRKKWKGYRSSVKSDSTLWGLSGITAVLLDSIDTLKIKANYKNFTKWPYSFSRIRFFVDASCLNYSISLIDSTNCIVSDSLNIEYGFIEYKLMHETETALFEIRKRDTSSVSLFKLMGVELMNEKPGIEYTSIGVNGASFESYNRCTLFEKQLSLYQPDLFIISIGTNDAYTTDFKDDKFAAYYESLIQTILKINPQCAILMTVPNDSYYRRKYPNKNTARQQIIIHQLARKYQMAVWDFYSIMGGLGSSQKWYLKQLMPRDRIHFTSLGYSIKADLLLKAIVLQWEKSTGREPESILKMITGKNE